MPTSANTPDQRSDGYARYIQVGTTPATRLSRWVHPNGTTKSHPPPSIVKALTPPRAVVRPPSVERIEVQQWSTEEASRFLAATVDHRLHALFAVGVAIGLRKGELLARSSRLISAQSSTLNTHFLLTSTKGQHLGEGQISTAARGSVFTCRRQSPRGGPASPVGRPDSQPKGLARPRCGRTHSRSPASPDTLRHDPALTGTMRSDLTWLIFCDFGPAVPVD
jgi:hypothetical protein